MAEFKVLFRRLIQREVLCNFLRLRRIPAGIIGLLTGLYSKTERAVKCGRGESNFFLVHTGVRQGCVLAPSLIYTCMDWALSRVVDQGHSKAFVG